MSSRRLREIFQGKLTDQELYWIEDALNGEPISKEIAEPLIIKLYANFNEMGKFAPSNKSYPSKEDA